jgi:hypothetical protein
VTGSQGRLSLPGPNTFYINKKSLHFFMGGFFVYTSMGVI